jgi:ABC-type long-subunit fatty acid transport system fused permease/ATPase subunit
MTPINRFLKNYSAVGSLLQRKKEFMMSKIIFALLWVVLWVVKRFIMGRIMGRSKVRIISTLKKLQYNEFFVAKKKRIPDVEK